MRCTRERAFPCERAFATARMAKFETRVARLGRRPTARGRVRATVASHASDVPDCAALRPPTWECCKHAKRRSVRLRQLGRSRRFAKRPSKPSHRRGSTSMARRRGRWRRRTSSVLSFALSSVLFVACLRTNRVRRVRGPGARRSSHVPRPSLRCRPTPGVVVVFPRRTATPQLVVHVSTESALAWHTFRRPWNSAVHLRLVVFRPPFHVHPQMPWRAAIATHAASSSNNEQQLRDVATVVVPNFRIWRERNDEGPKSSEREKGPLGTSEDRPSSEGMHRNEALERKEERRTACTCPRGDEDE